MSKYQITTPYGDVYTIDEQWRISKRGVAPSGQWALVAIAELLPFGHIRELPRETLEELSKQYVYGSTFKNGKPRYTVIDNDHGTCRIWGNTKYHGIKYVYKSEEAA